MKILNKKILKNIRLNSLIVFTLSSFASSPSHALNTEAIQRSTVHKFSSSSVINTPYFLQRENQFEPGSTCGLTSAAMLLGYWTERQASEEILTPDDLYREYGKRQGQSPEALYNLYREIGLKGNYTYTGTRLKIKQQLDKGRPVVVHGWFTRNGHIILIVGYNDRGFIVNDPAGDWQRCYKCGYKPSSNGNEKLYSYEAMNSKVLGKDGDIWMSYAY